MWSLLNAIISLVGSNLSSHNRSLENNTCTMLCRKIGHYYHSVDITVWFFTREIITLSYFSVLERHWMWYPDMVCWVFLWLNLIIIFCIDFFLQFRFIFSITIDVILCTSSYFSIHLWFTVFLSLLDPAAIWFILPTLPKTSFRKKE
jgi:hypothetical protein